MTHDTPPAESARPTLVAISGLPASGKSTLATSLADELGWPVFTKDSFKELLFDVAGRGEGDFSEEESERLGAQAIALLLTIADALIRAGVSVVLEANFRADLAADQLERFLARAEVRHVYCAVDLPTIVERYQRRLDQDERHPVHRDSGDPEALIAATREKDYGPIRLDIPTLFVDTADGFNPPIERIAAFCRTGVPSQ